MKTLFLILSLFLVGCKFDIMALVRAVESEKPVLYGPATI